MKDQLITARRAVNLPWIDDGRYYELTTGKRPGTPKIAKSPTAFACMTIRGQELANIPWHIKSKKTGEVVEDHPLVRILKDFGPESNWQRAILYNEIDLLNTGGALWLWDVDILKRLDPGTIEVLKNNDGIIGFKQTLTTPEGKEKVNVYMREEIVYFREFNPDDDLDFGIAVMDVCKQAVDAEIEALEMLKWHFKNDAVPGLFLSSDKDISPKTAREVISWWESRFRGPRNKGKVGIAGRGLKPTSVGSNMKESAVMEALDSIHKDICKPFRVDPILVGGNTDATYVNLSESRKFLIEDVIMPRSVEYANVINQDLCEVRFPEVEFEFDFDEVQILQEDATQKHLRLSGAVSMGLISEEYYRAEMGYPEESQPDEEAKEERRREKEAEAKFEKKAVKAFLRGEDPNVPFESDYIPVDRQYVIRGRLQNAKTEDAVRACFG